MVRNILRATLMLLVMTVLTGVIYPLAVTGAAQVLFPHQANGSLIVGEGRPVGSALIGQTFTGSRYFHGRPSAAGSNGYESTASSGSNLGPTNKQLIETVATRATQIRKENSRVEGIPVPSDLVTSSASGLDPDITREAAYLQCARVAQSRNLPEATVRSLVEKHIQQRQFGVLGELRVNVLQLNLDLDHLGQ